MLVTGVALIVLGVLFVMLGLASAFREVFKAGQQHQPLQGVTDPESWAKLVSALTGLVKVAPQWFLLVFVGLALVAGGVAMVVS